VPYAGLGPSAHEFDGAARRWNARAYIDWLERLEVNTDPIEESEELTAENRGAEEVYLGLRTTNGLLISESEAAHVQPWIQAGWADLTSGRRLVLRPLGWLRLDALAADLTVLRSRY
jgi:oxygen-independent coproporphyrinogen-3 oxidase